MVINEMRTSFQVIQYEIIDFRILSAASLQKTLYLNKLEIVYQNHTHVTKYIYIKRFVINLTRIKI